MRTVIKTFAELTARELYEILRLRAKVFVVEQNCPYEDPDGLDPDALHVWLENRNGIAAYLRVLPPDQKSPAVKIGRVIAARRRMGFGSAVLSAGIRAARERFGAETIRLDAQTYAVPFYEKAGFAVVTDEFDEDGIPHVGMELPAPHSGGAAG